VHPDGTRHPDRASYLPLHYALMHEEGALDVAAVEMLLRAFTPAATEGTWASWQQNTG
jgi:hypothetical protein